MEKKKYLKLWKRKIIDLVYEARFKKYENRIRSSELSYYDAHDFIRNSLKSSKPFFTGRLGAVECWVCWNSVRAGFESTGHNKKMVRGATNNAGISQLGDEAFDRFSAIYLAALPYADLIGTWEVAGMFPLLWKYASPQTSYTERWCLEPWMAHRDNRAPWTSALAGKRVLVITPFAKSVAAQFNRRKDVKTISQILPDFELLTHVPPVTLAGWDNGKTWADNLQTLMNEVAQLEFDIAIIGCGSYGLPLGAFIKQTGRKAIHLGGVTQLFFGVRGKHWDEIASYADLIDDSWVRPAPEDRPPNAHTVDNGAYW